jgi:hypothetical protein
MSPPEFPAAGEKSAYHLPTRNGLSRTKGEGKKQTAFQRNILIYVKLAVLFTQLNMSILGQIANKCDESHFLRPDLAPNDAPQCVFLRKMRRNGLP